MSIFAIIDYRAKKEAIVCLYKFFDKVVLTSPLNVQQAIDGHADISVCKIADNEIVVCPSLYNYYKSELPEINIFKGSSEPDYKYPNDVIYNAACSGSVAIHNFEFTDKTTLAVIKQKFSKHINVHQGYSKCSICFVKNNGLITDDEGIYKEVKNHEIDALKITKGDVKLHGMNYGFFGGATGCFENKLFLNGEVKYHKDKNKIVDYLNKHNVELIEIKKGPIEDIGSIICLSKK